MPTPTFDLVASTITNGTTNAVSFSGLSGYTNYCIMALAGISGTNSRYNLRFNSRAGSNYGNVAWTSDGTTLQAGEQSSLSIWDLSSPVNMVQQQLGDSFAIIDFANDVTNVTFANFNCKQMCAGITTYTLSSGQCYPGGQTTSSLYLTTGSGNNFLSGSAFYLFGVI